MNTNQFSLMTYQWLLANVLPVLAPQVWQQQLIVFNKGRELAQKMSLLADNLTKDANGNIDLDDLEKRFDEMFKINQVFAFPINEPALALIGISPEYTLKFTKTDTDNFIATLRGRTVTTQVTL